MTDIISTDHSLSPAQREALTALLDTLLPASEDGRLPGAGSQDPGEYLHNPAVPDFEQTVGEMVDALGDHFAGLSPAAREERVSSYQHQEPERFSQVYLQALAVYYRRRDVLRAIGSGEGPPFPRGNEVADGDLSLLDPVLAGAKSYRRP